MAWAEQRFADRPTSHRSRCGRRCGEAIRARRRAAAISVAAHERAPAPVDFASHIRAKLEPVGLIVSSSAGGKPRACPRSGRNRRGRAADRGAGARRPGQPPGPHSGARAGGRQGRVRGHARIAHTSARSRRRRTPRAAGSAVPERPASRRAPSIASRSMGRPCRGRARYGRSAPRERPRGVRALDRDATAS